MRGVSCVSTGVLHPFAAVVNLREWRGDTRNVDFEVRQHPLYSFSRAAIVEASDVGVIFPGFRLHVVVFGAVKKEAKDQIGLAERDPDWNLAGMTWHSFALMDAAPSIAAIFR